MRTDRLHEELGVQFEWLLFPLHPEIPEHGTDLSELFAASGYDLSAIQQRLDAVAHEEGLPLRARHRISNSRKAQELGKYAEKMGLMQPYEQSIYRAYFAEGRDIGNLDELVAVAERAGLRGDDARNVLAEGIFSEPVDTDWRRARLMGITGVPSFICGNRIMVGFHPYQDFVKLVQGAGS